MLQCIEDPNNTRYFTPVDQAVVEGIVGPAVSSTLYLLRNTALFWINTRCRSTDNTAIR